MLHHYHYILFYFSNNILSFEIIVSTINSLGLCVSPLTKMYTPHEEQPRLSYSQLCPQEIEQCWCRMMLHGCLKLTNIF